MKNYNGLLAAIFSVSLVSIGTSGLAITTNTYNAFAQSINFSTVKTNSIKPEKTHVESMFSTSTTYLTPISIIVSACLGVATYTINESWKRRQYLEEKIKSFEDKREAINVRKMLNAELQCVELFPFLEKPTHRFVIVEDSLWVEALLECKCNTMLKEQLESINKDDEKFYLQLPAEKACIRDNFNRYLDYLQQFEKMVESGVINQKKLETYLLPWFDLVGKVNDIDSIQCPCSGKNYSPKKALLEYMGLLEDMPEKELSIIQKDVSKLVLRFDSDLLVRLKIKKESKPLSLSSPVESYNWQGF